MSATLEHPTSRVTEPRKVAPAKDGRKLIRSQVRTGWLLLSPALLHSAIFIVVPVIAVLALSLTDYSFGDSWSWVGFGNYSELFRDVDFQASLVNTVLYAIVVIPLSMAISLAIAIGLNQKIRAIGFFRTAFYIPTVTATVAIATIWLWIYNPGSGLANGFLGLFGFAPNQWLAEPGTALPSLMVVGIWQGLGTKIIIYLAALQGVSRDLLESADLDGANRWQKFRNVTWPALGPVQFFVLITSIVGTFQVFDLVYVMTRGGPGTETRVLVLDIYQNAFQDLKLGYASAETVIMMILIALFIGVGRLLQKADVND
ncbi:carbohydrate ABC transporter membrane protein 1 (CUT1 family) [Kribbella amoyensis]|uniref:Carbohydrate ABC transporter membrane protein 1 (CUT1 family) n=1 Tax=Kribbella amoyensis TaxID=996641 RepID=A0A561BQ15_9ACTN|nr:sugar ABC transporter permease [Kribbella amoyensis]TWD80961.1 carbohydrate ABC transporter membrane protein 1 (CUT1 family) [Kribbella amoyensis]